MNLDKIMDIVFKTIKFHILPMINFVIGERASYGRITTYNRSIRLCFPETLKDTKSIRLVQALGLRKHKSTESFLSEFTID